MRVMRWVLVFALVAVAAMYIGAKSTVAKATAQDFQIIDQDNGQVQPRLVEPRRGPAQDRPGFGPGPGMQMGPQMMGAPAPVAMWGDEKHIYILRGERVFKLQKEPLKVVAELRLPPEPRRAPGPEFDRGPDQGPPPAEGGGEGEE